MPQLVFNRTPVQTGNVIPVITLGVTDSSRHRHGMPLCQQPVESCSDVANPLGNRATAGSQCLMTQLSPGVVIAVEEVVLFFNSFVQPMDLLDGILPRLVVRRNYNTKIFWGLASRDCRFCVGADGPGGFSFAIRKFYQQFQIQLAWFLLSAAAGGTHCQPTHMSRTGHARLPPFLPLLIYHVLSLPRTPDPQSSQLPFPFLLHTFTRSSWLHSSLSSWLHSSLSSALCQVCHAQAGVRAHVLLFGKPRSKQEQQWFYFTSGLVFWLDTVINVSCSYAKNLPGGFTSVKWTNP